MATTTTNSMRDHFDLLFNTPEREEAVPVAPVEPATPAPATTVPTTPAIGAPLQAWLLQQTSGHNVLTPEMYQFFGGDEILQNIQQFDPNARWVITDIGGGEGGGQGRGFQLQYDATKLPRAGPPDDSGHQWVPVDRELRDPSMVYNDPIYGPLTIAANRQKQKDPWWVTVAPLVVAAAATGGAALGAAPAMAGVAGGTAGVTGGAAGLAAGNIAAGAAGSTPWWAQVLSKAPNVARAVTPAPAASTPAPTSNTPPMFPDQFNAANFNRSGSAAKPESGDSALVATQFAVDPYGASQQ